MIDTKESLLGRLKAENAQDAWKEFYHLYWAPILGYSRKLGLNQHESEEVLQETMVTLMRILPEFVYDRKKGRFRNFLLTIVHRKSLAVMRQKARDSSVPWENARTASNSYPFADDAANAEHEKRWREALVEEALRRLRDDHRLGERTLAIFEAYVLEQRAAPVVAQSFGVNENAVYQVRNRLIKRLQFELAKLMKGSGSSFADEG